MKDKNLKKRIYFILPRLIVIFAFAVSISAQTTAFNYQGKLNENGTSANGNYLLQFKLFDAISGGTQIGSTVSDVAVTAAQGVFTTQIDFGSSAFPGADRFLEIAVKKNAGDSYTNLSPREQISASPYSIRTISAQQADLALDSNKLGGVDANQYVTTSSVGNSFIKNSTTQQTGDFNISGNGIVGSNLGIGATPQSGLSLDVTGNSIFRTANGNVNIGTPSGEAGMTISKTNRADIRFDGTTLKLLAGTGIGAMASTNGINIDRFGNVGIGTTTPLAKLHVAGNAVQDRDKSGTVKALLYVGENGTIVECYNGISGASTGNCGFLVTLGSSGSYSIDLGFKVTDRFLSVTAQDRPLGIGLPILTKGANFRFKANPNVVAIDTFLAATGEPEDSPFMLIVY